MTEIWKSIDGYEGLYEVSNLGRVRSLNYGHTGTVRVLKPGHTHNGYLMVCLCKNGNQKMFHVHRLVSQAFLPNPQNLPEINHKNELKTDNRVENLEWCSREYNTNYGTGNKRRSEALRGKPHPHSGKPLSEETKRKISEAQRGKKRKPFSDEHKLKLSESKKRYWETKKQEQE